MLDGRGPVMLRGAKQQGGRLCRSGIPAWRVFWFWLPCYVAPDLRRRLPNSPRPNRLRPSANPAVPISCRIAPAFSRAAKTRFNVSSATPAAYRRLASRRWMPSARSRPPAAPTLRLHHLRQRPIGLGRRTRPRRHRPSRRRSPDRRPRQCRTKPPGRAHRKSVRSALLAVPISACIALA
jgi:hypothetical protein